MGRVENAGHTKVSGPYFGYFGSLRVLFPTNTLTDDVIIFLAGGPIPKGRSQSYTFNDHFLALILPSASLFAAVPLNIFQMELENEFFSVDDHRDHCRLAVRISQSYEG